MQYNNSGIILAVGILVVVFVFIIGRALVMWWLGTAEISAQQKELIELFKRYLDAQDLLIATLQRTNNTISRAQESVTPHRQSTQTQPPASQATAAIDDKYRLS